MTQISILFLHCFDKSSQDSPIECIADLLAKHPDLTLSGLREQMEEEKLQDCIQQLFDEAGLTETEKHLLLQFAVLPTIPIAYSLLTDFLNISEEKEAEFRDTLDSLVQKTWLCKEESAYSCYPMIQEMVRTHIPPTVEGCKALLTTFIDKLYIEDTQENPADAFQWIPYGESLGQWIQEEKEEMAELLDRLGNVFYHKGQYDQGALVRSRALSIAEKLYGKEGKKTSRFLNNLALMYQSQGNYAAAKEMYTRALVLSRKHLGAEHASIAILHSNLGTVLGKLGEHTAAKRELQQALALNLRRLGENHPTIASDRSNLGTALYALGDYIGAKVECERALALLLTHLGEEHPKVAALRANLGNVLSELGEYEAAQRELEKALAFELRYVGEQHPRVAILCNNLGRVYEDSEAFGSALTYFGKAYALFMQLLGERHPYIRIVANNIRRVRAKMSRY